MKYLNRFNGKSNIENFSRVFQISCERNNLPATLFLKLLLIILRSLTRSYQVGKEKFLH